MSDGITRPALRYYGGKWRIAPWVISHFPEHSVYVEPFAGAGSVLLRKEPSTAEVLNDLDGNVVNYFRVLRERTSDLLRAIEFTPFSREEANVAGAASDDPLERARRFHIRSWQTMHGAPYIGKNGWRFGRAGGNGKRNAIDDWNDVDRLPAIAKRLKTVQIEQDDAVGCIQRFDSPKTLFYCDPPYVASTRASRWRGDGYVHEMTDEQHRGLAEVLRGIKGMAIVSGYSGSLYEDLYKGWKMASCTNYSARSTPRTEILWFSPAAAAAGKQLELGVG